MGKCRKEIYTDNKIIKNIPFVCFGGAGCKACEYLKECVEENNLRLGKKNRLVL
jgi:hypothetical protein